MSRGLTLSGGWLSIASDKAWTWATTCYLWFS